MPDLHAWSDAAEAERVGKRGHRARDVRTVVIAAGVRARTRWIGRVIAAEGDEAARTEAAAQDRVEVVDAAVDDRDLDVARAEDALVVQVGDTGHDVWIEGVVGVGGRGREVRAAALRERCGVEGRRLGRFGALSRRCAKRCGASENTQRPRMLNALDAVQSLEDLLDGRFAALSELLQHIRVVDLDDGAMEERRASGELASGRKGWESGTVDV